jgi:hypothetical protein
VGCLIGVSDSRATASTVTAKTQARQLRGATTAFLINEKVDEKAAAAEEANDARSCSGQFQDLSSKEKEHVQNALLTWVVIAEAQDATHAYVNYGETVTNLQLTVPAFKRYALALRNLTVSLSPLIFAAPKLACEVALTASRHDFKPPTTSSGIGALYGLTPTQLHVFQDFITSRQEKAYARSDHQAIKYARTLGVRIPSTS